MEVTTISNIFDPKIATYIRTYQHYLSVAPTLMNFISAQICNPFLTHHSKF